MDVRALKRNPQAIKQAVKKTGDSRIIAIKECTIHIPAKFADKELAVMDEQVYILGVYALICGNDYAISKVLGMVKINPSSTRRVMIEDVEYIEFGFVAGATIFDELDVVKKNTLVYNIYDVFVDAGLTPWYLGYEDKLTLFKDTPFYNGITLGANRAVMEMIIATTARNPAKRTQYYRQIDTRKQTQVAWVPFKSIVFGPKTTTAKFSGAYFDQGLISALTHPSERPEKIEQLLRQ